MDQKARHCAAQAKYHQTEKGRAVGRTACSKLKQSNRNKAVELLGPVCAGQNCHQVLKTTAHPTSIAWGAHHRTPRAVTGRPLIYWNWSWARIKTELQHDVELLCIPCHRAIPCNM